MASSADVRDIMGMAPQDTTITKDSILGTDKKKVKKSVGNTFQRPEGMHRELYNLLYSENKELPCPLIQTDTSKDLGYKQMRAKLGMRRVRPWKWMPFTNPARKDGLILNHWRRAQEEGKDYPFARFNKVCEVPTYTELEFGHHLATPGWTRQETDHLMDLASRFDLRFIVMADRWDSNTYSPRSVEDLKERYYSIVEKLERVHGGATGAQEQNKKTFVYDAEHERRRKEQLRRLYNRTQDQLDEEDMLKAELRKIEARKKEREKKTADLQKMIAQADASNNEMKKIGKKQKIGGVAGRLNRPEPVQIDQTGIKWPDGKSSGVSLRSTRMKLPTSVGLKKTKAIETMCTELGLEMQPSCTEEICSEFNELRSEMVLLYELKNALTNSEFELTSLSHQYEALVPGKSLSLPPQLLTSNTTLVDGAIAAANLDKEQGKKKLVDVIDVVGGSREGRQDRKRKAALEQSNILKKIKKRTYQ